MKNVKFSHFFLFIIIIIFLLWSVIQANDYFTWMLEVSPAVIGLLVLLFTYTRFRLTTLSYLIITILVVLMFIGGHYTYADVPLFSWLKGEFHLQQNNYDRFGHFAKGSFIIVIRELLLRNTCIKPSKWMICITLSIILAISAIYEIIEWLVAKIVGRSAKSFLATQGDVWDSQWDMSLTFIGAILSLLLLSKLHNRIMNKELK
jgi:putative membrane protein|nr:DUF2238 domain-containing protein [Heyndrickxia oleronia]